MYTFFKEEEIIFSQQENEAIIVDAGKIYEALNRFIEDNQSNCLRNHRNISVWPNTDIWLTLFKKISQCDANYNPFDSIAHLLLKQFESQPNFEADLRAGFQSDKLESIKKLIEKFKQDYAISLALCLHFVNLNKKIKQDIKQIADSITQLFKFHSGKNASLLHDLENPLIYKELLNPEISLDDKKSETLKTTEKKLNAIYNLLNHLTDGANESNAAGYRHLKDSLKGHYNELPDKLEALKDNLFLLISHIEQASIKDGLFHWIKGKVESLHLNIACLKQGDSSTNLKHWSKLCLPRSDYQTAQKEINISMS